MQKYCTLIQADFADSIKSLSFKFSSAWGRTEQEKMSCSVAKLPYYREIGCHAATSRTRPRFLQGCLKSFHNFHMKDIYCRFSDKYHVPGETELETPPYAVEFCTAPSQEEVFAVADEDGYISILSVARRRFRSTPNFSLKPVHRFRAHNNAIFDIAWVPHETFLYTASGDQAAALWDVPKGEVVTMFKGHSCSVKSVNVSKHNTNLFATGSRDGNALVWDRRLAQLAVRIQDAHVVNDSLTPMRKRRISLAEQTGLVKDSRQTVSCVVFQESHIIITSGAMDGTLKIWDLRKIRQPRKMTAKGRNTPVETISYPGTSLRRRGYTCLTLDSSSTHLYASCTDDSIYHYNLATAASGGKRQPLCTYKGHYNTSFYVRTALSPGNEFLLSGSDDNRAHIWRANSDRASPVMRLMSDGMSEVTAVAWCPNDMTKLITCSDECAVRLWTLSYNGKEHLKSSEIDGEAEEVVEWEDGKSEDSRGKNFTVAPTEIALSTTSNSPVTTKEFFTPEKASALTPQTSAAKISTELRNPSRVTLKTPTSIEKWLVRPSPLKETNPSCSKSRAVKCLEGHMTRHQPRGKENLVTPKKNWLAELSRNRKKGSCEKSPASKRRKAVPPSPSGSANDRTPLKQIKTLDAYFSPPSS